MPEIEEELSLEVEPGNMVVNTALNGDKITIRGLHLTPEQAATLAWLTNTHDVTLELELRIKV